MTEGGASGRDRAERMLAKATELEQQAARMREVARHVVTGAEGEEAVAATLNSLRAGGWVVLHDRRKAPRSPANIDHLVVGPMGLLVIDAKKWSGRVTFNNGTLRCNGYSRQSTITATVEVADLLRAELAVEGFGDVPVSAVLCFDGDAALTRVIEVSPTLHLVPRSRLKSWLAEQPRVVTADRAQALGAHLDRSHRPRSEPSRFATPLTPRQPAWSKPSQRAPGRPSYVHTASAPQNRMPAPTRPPAKSRRSGKRPKSWVQLAATTAAILIGLGALSDHGSASTGSRTSSRPNSQLGVTRVGTEAAVTSAQVCRRLAIKAAAVLGTAVSGALSSSADECEYRTDAGLVVAYTRTGRSVRLVSGMATLTTPTPVQLSCGVGFFQPAGHPLPDRPSVTARETAASCVSAVRLGLTQQRASKAARALVTAVESS